MHIHSTQLTYGELRVLYEPTKGTNVMMDQSCINDLREAKAITYIPPHILDTFQHTFQPTFETPFPMLYTGKVTPLLLLETGTLAVLADVV